MVKFILGDYETDEHNWAKHHKKLGNFVKVVYEDGEVTTTQNETLLKIMEEQPELLVSKDVKLLRSKENKVVDATYYYLMIENQDYKNGDIRHYHIGATNTKQTAYVRLKFMFGDAVAYIDTEYSSRGSYAQDVGSYISNPDIISDIIDELSELNLSREESLSEKGIHVYGDSDSDPEVHIVVVDTTYFTETVIDIEVRELEQAFVGIELYDFKQTIVD